MIRRGRPPSAARHRPRGTRGLWLLLPVFFFRSPMSVWVFLHTWFMVYVAGTGRAASAGDHHHREENGPRGRSVPHNVGCGLLQQSSCHWGVRAGTGGIPDVGPTAGSMAEEATFAGFDTLMRGGECCLLVLNLVSSTLISRISSSVGSPGSRGVYQGPRILHARAGCPAMMMSFICSCRNKK